MKRFLKITAITALVLLVVGGGLAWRERNVGTGPIATARAPAADAREVAFIANAVAGTVTAYDLERREVVGTMNVVPDGKKVGFFRSPLQKFLGQPPYEKAGGLNFAQDLDVSPDGRVLYVSRGHLGDVAAFDLMNGALMWRREVNIGRSDHMAITPDGRYLLVSAMTVDKVKRIDTRTAQINGEFNAGAHPHDNQVSPDGRRIYNASLGDMSVPETQRAAVLSKQGEYPYQIAVGDVATMRVVDRLPFARGVRPFHLTHDGRRLFAQLSNQHDVIEYDVGAKRIVRTLRLPVAAGVSVEDWDFEAPHHGLAMTPDGSTLCVAGRASDYAGIVSTRPLALVATVPVDDAPSWSVIDRTGRYCLTANTRADTVSVVSLADRSLVARFPAGRGAKHITMGRVSPQVIAAMKARAPRR